MENLFILILALLAVVQGASLSAKYSEKVAEGFKLSRYIVGFIVVSFISILPEMFIAVNAALQGQPDLGIGTLFGSNVADLTLIFAILVFIAGKRGIKVEKGIMKKMLPYPLFLMIPLLLGLDGEYTRTEGIALIIVGVIFYFSIFSKSVGLSSHDHDIRFKLRNTTLLILSLGLLLIGAHFTASAATDLAHAWGVRPVLIGVLIVSLGTTIPELFFSAKAVKNKRDSLAVGDILGSVLADATIVVGIVAVIAPFTFPQIIAYVAGVWMVISSIVLLYFMRTRHKIVRREALVLIAMWVLYVIAEIAVSIVEK